MTVVSWWRLPGRLPSALCSHLWPVAHQCSIPVGPWTKAVAVEKGEVRRVDHRRLFGSLSLPAKMPLRTRHKVSNGERHRAEQNWHIVLAHLYGVLCTYEHYGGRVQQSARDGKPRPLPTDVCQLHGLSVAERKTWPDHAAPLWPASLDQVYWTRYFVCPVLHFVVLDSAVHYVAVQ